MMLNRLVNRASLTRTATLVAFRSSTQVTYASNKGNNLQQSRFYRADGLPKNDEPVRQSEKSPGDFIVEEEFMKIDVLPEPRNYFSRRRVRRQFGRVTNPRSARMATNQDWTAVWPTNRVFHPATVPLPLYQGYVKTKAELHPRPDRWANVELMKIPNFLHLSPPAIKQQAAAIRKFCTRWPAGLETDELCEAHFPLEVITSDYVQALPSIRNPDARIVQIRFRLDRLQLDQHARDKLIKLLQHRYDPASDLVTIEAKACPFKKQNLDHAKYMLTAAYFESWKTEPWELEEAESTPTLSSTSSSSSVTPQQPSTTTAT